MHNWYKTALTKYGMSLDIFFEFYALQALSDDVLQEHPEVLFRLIEIINYLRDYYLTTLFKDMAEEIVYYSNLVDILGDRYDWPNGRNATEEQHYITNVVISSIKDFHGDNFNLTPIIEQHILWVFGEFPHWHKYFGGKRWAQEAEIIFKLYHVGELAQGPYSPGLMSQARNAIVLLDTVHSLEHNSGLVLTDLPEKEKYWLHQALNIVFDSMEPVYLADISNNRKLSELYRREVNPLDGTRSFENNVRQSNEVLRWVKHIRETIDGEGWFEIDPERGPFKKLMENLDDPVAWKTLLYQPGWYHHSSRIRKPLQPYVNDIIVYIQEKQDAGMALDLLDSGLLLTDEYEEDFSELPPDLKKSLISSHKSFSFCERSGGF